MFMGNAYPKAELTNTMLKIDWTEWYLQDDDPWVFVLIRICFSWLYNIFYADTIGLPKEENYHYTLIQYTSLTWSWISIITYF